MNHTLTLQQTDAFWGRARLTLSEKGNSQRYSHESQHPYSARVKFKTIASAYRALSPVWIFLSGEYPTDNYLRRSYHALSFCVVATQAVRSKPQVCAEKKRLAHLFIESVREVMTLQEREMTEVVREGIGLQRFELAIERARSKRDQAREAYQLHVQMHCC